MATARGLLKLTILCGARGPSDPHNNARTRHSTQKLGRWWTRYSSSSLPLLRAFLTFAPPAAPPPAEVALPVVNVAFWPDVTDEAENMRSASRNLLMRRIAPDEACLPRYPSHPLRMLPSFSVSYTRELENGNLGKGMANGVCVTAPGGTLPQGRRSDARCAGAPPQTLRCSLKGL